ncbi:type II secretion system F family protein [Cellulomonas sp. KRMCY2]|uniref:type II secretion system F family protein n=1 Tax=Cellulomonas sp. KRMCY2 TaxID=1304865 RepID=UPI0004AF936D|nr:type II secretion system F family protein [Cellulomonas sp. KRMCY2]
MSVVGRRLPRLRQACGAPVPVPSVEVELEVDVAVALDLLDAACAAGVSVPRALTAVGHAIGGERGASLVDVAVALGLGAPWPEAWEAGHPALRALGEALRPSWEDGVAPASGLRAAAEAVRRDRHARALEAAGRLGVRLVLPLGLCYLPAFVLVGLVPVLLSMAAGALGG